MMRTIKFRAWSKYGMLSWLDLCTTLDPMELVDLENRNYIFMQFTGLFDKNGKEIYEGDILKRNNSPCYKVLFADGSYRMNGKSKDGSFEFKINQDKAGLMEVIGNVYKNPDLLKGE